MMLAARAADLRIDASMVSIVSMVLRARQNTGLPEDPATYSG
jgi:hypothetical protein